MYSSDRLEEEEMRTARKTKAASTYTPKNNQEETSLLQSQLNELEHQYARMEAEYFRQVKELKVALSEKTRKQLSLTTEITALREEFRLHQEQIQKISEEVTKQNNQEKEPVLIKKSSSPGLIRKSLELDKKNQKKMSPNTHISITNYLPETKNVEPKTVPNASPPARRPGTKALSPGFLTLLKKNIPTENSLKLVVPKQHNDTTQTMDKSEGEKKKGSSPTTSHSIKETLTTSIKNNKTRSPQAVKGSSPASVKPKSPMAGKQSIPVFNTNNVPLTPTNSSPRRIVRRSPGQKGVVKLEVKKQGKKLLGKLKQTIEEQVF